MNEAHINNSKQLCAANMIQSKNLFLPTFDAFQIFVRSCLSWQRENEQVSSVLLLWKNASKWEKICERC